MYYGGPYGMMGLGPALTEDEINITSPRSVPAGAIETVKVHVKVPSDARGYYNGYIDLGIDDPSVRDYEGRVHLSFNIWKQPTQPFVKSFSLDEAAPITIAVNSYNYMGKSQKSARIPSFETSLEDPDGKIVDLNVTSTVIKGHVNMGSERPPWEVDSESIYQENGVQYTVIYRADGSPGNWTLRVLPGNTQGFEYTITIGG